MNNTKTKWNLQQITEKVRQIIAEEVDAEDAAITPDARLQEDLGADSLTVLEVVMKIEETFGVEIPDEDVDQIRTVSEICEYLNKRLNGEN